MKFLKKFFYEPQYGPVSDAAMLSRVLRSAAIIIACLFLMSLSAFAWFTANVTSGQNKISAANFDVTAEIAGMTPTDGRYYLTDGEYPIQLTRSGDASTGFVVVKITVDGGQTAYHTRQIQDDQPLQLVLRFFGLTEPAVVEFVPHWGTSAYYGTTGNPLYLENDVLEISVDGSGNESESQEPEDQDAVTQEPEFPEPELQEPSPQEPQPSEPEATEYIYTVQPGDTLIWIADNHHIDVQVLAEYNNLNVSDVLPVGLQLRFPPDNLGE